MKKLASITLAILMSLLFLAGCTGASNSKTQGNASSTQAGGETADAEESAVTILSYMGEGSKRNALKKLTDNYTALHPEVSFTIQDMDMGNFMSVLQTRIAAGDAPDLIMGSAAFSRHLVEAGQVMDLSGASFMQTTGEQNLMSSMVDGKAYSLPIDWSVMGTFYNKDMFAQHNLPEPTTYTEFMNACKTFEDEGIVPFTRAFKDANNVMCDFSTQWYPLLEISGELNYFLDIQAGTKKFSDYPLTRDAFALFAERLAFLSDDDLGTDSAVSLQRFAAGKSPMHVDGSWAVGDIVGNNPDGNFGLFPTPINDTPEDNLVYKCVDDSWMVSAQTKNKDAVFGFLDYHVSPEGINLWATEAVALTYIPAEDTSSLPPLMQDILKLDADDRTIDAEKFPYFSGEAYDLFNKDCQLFVSMEDRDMDAFLEQLDNDFQALSD